MSSFVAELFQPVLDKLTSWSQQGVSMLPNLVVAVIVIAVAGLLSRQARKWTTRGMDNVLTNRQIASLLGRVSQLAVVAVGIFLALSALDLDKTVSSLLAGAGVVGLAIGFAAQKLVANWMSGVLIAAQRPYRLGDWVEAAGHLGQVQDVGLRATTLRTPDGRTVLVPNGELYDTAVINWSTEPPVRVDVAVGCSYADDLSEALRVTAEALAPLDRIQDRPVEVFATGFGGSSIDLVARIWVLYESPKTLHETRTAAMVAIQEAWAEAGLSIPFPIRTLDFGVAGGEGLRSHLESVQLRAVADPDEAEEPEDAKETEQVDEEAAEPAEALASR